MLQHVLTSDLLGIAMPDHQCFKFSPLNYQIILRAHYGPQIDCAAHSGVTTNLSPFLILLHQYNHLTLMSLTQLCWFTKICTTSPNETKVWLEQPDVMFR